MMRVEESIAINRPVEEVFAYTTDPAHFAEWSQMVIDARQLSEGPMGVGTTIETTLQFLGRRFNSEQTVIEYVPNRVFTGRSTSGPIPMTITSRCEPVEGGTKFTWGGEGESKGFFAMADPLLLPIMRRQTQAMLGTLKDLLEARAGEPAQAGQ